ncbi:MAG: hypothetical protein N3J91_06825 [Verrucomicrobiae bacterium]|nr:hypothetical protein [Verrucomicrobiae bacterium]
MSARRTTIWMAAALLLAGGLTLPAANDPVMDRFAGIPDRNAFGLRPPPPPPPPPKPEPPPPAIKVQITGLLDFKVRKTAILLVSELGKNPVSIVLGENESEGPVTVKSIDAENGKIRIALNNTDTELDIEKDGVKPLAGSGKADFQIGGPVEQTPRPSASQLFAGVASAGAPAVPAVDRNNLAAYLRQASEGASKSAASAPAPLFGGAGGSPYGGLAGSHTFRFDGPPTSGPTQPNWPPEQPVSYEESIIHMELLRTIKDTGKVELPPLPPTILTPGHEEEMPPVPGGQPQYGPPGLPPLPPFPR